MNFAKNIGFNVAAPHLQGQRTLHIYQEGLFSSNYRIVDTDKTTVLYTIELHSFTSPHIRVYSRTSTADGSAIMVASADYHLSKPIVDLTIRGQETQFMKTCPDGSSCHRWFSVGFGNKMMIWGEETASRNRICYADDDRSQAIARLELTERSMSKKGKVHILCWSMTKEAFEELIVSAFVELQEVTRRRGNAAGSGGGGGGGGGGTS